MDPDVVVERIVDALELGDRLEAAEAMDELVAWMRKGGFAPKLDFATLDFLLSTYATWLRK